MRSADKPDAIPADPKSLAPKAEILSRTINRRRRLIRPISRSSYTRTASVAAEHKVAKFEAGSFGVKVTNESNPG